MGFCPRLLCVRARALWLHVYMLIFLWLLWRRLYAGILPGSQESQPHQIRRRHARNLPHNRTRRVRPLPPSTPPHALTLPSPPHSILCGVSVAVFNRYRIQNYIGWVISIVGFAVLSLIDADSSGVKLAGLQITAAIGVGVLYAAVTFPILAPLGVGENAHALAFFLFVRTFSYVSALLFLCVCVRVAGLTRLLGQTFGIAIGSTVMQNELKKRLPLDFLALFPPNQDIAYAAIDVIPTLDAATQQIVRANFASAISVIWKVLAGIAGAGLASCFIMREIPMSDELDDQWQLDQAGKSREVDLELNGGGGDKGESYVVRSPRTPEQPTATQ